MLVKVSEGILEGELLDNVLGKKYYSFKGIPYAAPPLGDLRFKPPQPPQKWGGKRSAKAHGPTCYQYNRGPVTESEDCLYLNVYTPNVKPAMLLPVMVFIHGGGFASGSGDSDTYGPDFLVDKGVVLVTFNYRLGVLGFLCLNTPEVPGNAGMKDQVAALKWVANNISSFGGDPKKVTVFGESAGAASVAYHLVSPMSKGLFKRAILQSGVATCHWAHALSPRERAKALARKLGKETDDDKELYPFFMSIHPLELLEIKLPLTALEKVRTTIEIIFSVVSEKVFGDAEVFFNGDVTDVFRSNIHEGVDVMTGYTADEGLLAFCVSPIEKVINQYEMHIESFAPRAIGANCLFADQVDVGKLMKNKYYGKNNMSKTLEPLIKFQSMDYVKYETQSFAQACARTNKLYFYSFECHSERNLFGKVFAGDAVGSRATVSHGDDLTYIFPMECLNIPLNTESLKIIDSVTTLWTNFAKFGNPTPDATLGFEWTPYSPKKQEYLKLSHAPEMRTCPDAEEVQLWNMVMRRYCPKYCVFQNKH